MNIPQIPLDFNAIIPEIALTALASIVLFLSLIKINKSIITWSGVFSLLAVTLLVFLHEGKAFGEMFLNDYLSIYLKIVILVGTIISILLLSIYLQRGLIAVGESVSLMMFAALGMMLLVSSRELISFFVSLELMSLSLYALMATRKYDSRANEAAIKYFLLGGLAAVTMLFGISILYGATGTTDFVHILNSVYTNSTLTLLGLTLFIVGLCFKVALVPFHMWVPDVYEGAPTPVTAFISTVPKVAVFGAFGRFLIENFSVVHNHWSLFLIVLSILTIVIGNLLALPQRNIKRMLAYSSIAHAGYIVLGIIVGTGEGFNSVLTYMLVYTFMNIGAFAVVIALNEEDIENYKGIHKFHPALSLAMLIFMFSLTGVPPTAGFIVKFNIFLQAIRADLAWLVVIAVLFTVVSAYYYLRVVMYIYMKDPVIVPRPALTKEMTISIALCSLSVVLLGIMPVFLI